MGANCMRFAEYIKDQKRNILCFILAFGTYLLNRCVLQAHTQNGVRYFCQCYLNDMLCPLCFLPLVDMLGAWVHHPLRRIRDVLLLIGCASLIWEGVTPAINPKSVFDWLDFLCYFAGAVAYWLLIHKSKSNKKPTF